MKGPHQGQPVLTVGDTPRGANAAVVMIHGRGASARDILSLVPELEVPGYSYLAPQAAGSTWYPYSFMAPIPDNEPGLSSGLAVIQEILTQLAAEGVPAERTILLGFSQGACLALEYAARNPRKYGGVVGLSGGLIGPDGTPWEYTGSLATTPVFLGCSDIDPHIPKKRVLESAQTLEELGGEVTMRLYEGMGHLVNQDELSFVRGILQAVK
jgi:predicted esterase